MCNKKLSQTEKESIEMYLTELQVLATQKGELEQRMRRLQLAIRGILALTDDEDELLAYFVRLGRIVEPAGFTNAIRKVLRSSNEPLTAAEVKERLGDTGFSLAGYSNPSALVHTILKRLAKGESVSSVTKSGVAAYQWEVAGDDHLAGVDVRRVGRKK